MNGHFAPGTRVRQYHLPTEEPSGPWSWECDSCEGYLTVHSGRHATREQAEQALTNHLANNHPRATS